MNLTPVEASGPGWARLITSGVADGGEASNVNYAVGTVGPNVAIAPIGDNGEVCAHNGPLASTP